MDHVEVVMTCYDTGCSGVARNFFEGLPCYKNSMRSVHAKIFEATPPLITTACTMVLDLDAKTRFYCL